MRRTGGLTLAAVLALGCSQRQSHLVRVTWTSPKGEERTECLPGSWVSEGSGGFFIRGGDFNDGLFGYRRGVLLSWEATDLCMEGVE